MKTLFLILICLLPPALSAQGFAGLGGTADGFAVPKRGHVLKFPQDHAPHDDFRIEWWYLTATLSGPDGTPYGLQWTLFRSALTPDGSEAPQLWMGHAAVTTPAAHYSAERIGRSAWDQAGVRLSDEFSAWIDDWHMTGGTDLTTLSLRASAPDFLYDMKLIARGPLMLQGDQGYSVKSSGGQASYYYSQPFYDISGTLDLPDGSVPVTGQAWLDREWSSQPLGADQTGWDWFSLSFASGARLMGFQLRGDDGPGFTSATWIDPDGTATPFPNGAFAAKPLEISCVAGRDVPTSWRVTLPAKAVDVQVNALNPDSWMQTSVPYWEGPISISGSHQGRGYLEMTGYVPKE